MRLKMFAFATLLAATAVTISGCNQEKKEDSVPGGYDLSHESNLKYLRDNALKPGVKSMPDGLQYKVIATGNGKPVTRNDDMVTVTYKGQLIDGKVFDQTPAGQTATFPAGGLIPGWVEALSMMHEGDEWQLVIPSNLGYGPAGAGETIPPNQTLVFDMKLISVKSPE
ncbi:MAG TPA: FKBP-type peptidyl-prolyl cis-trans isomerase [Rhizomicrobium sp.]|jgi:FKBP-type peptidyl-prolyl cis-trans isomerase|nr:FKBP-type peptidyl-prolyl cis-trans isomerase [Rhizomicrobium sp.]